MNKKELIEKAIEELKQAMFDELDAEDKLNEAKALVEKSRKRFQLAKEELFNIQPDVEPISDNL